MQEDIRLKKFGEDLSEWIDFVCACRDGNECFLNYNVIIGKVADEKAMNLYYNSKLARMIQLGEFDIQYLDYKVLTQMLDEELLKK